MPEIKSLTVSKALVERLKGIICCSESKAICQDDGFCSSDAGNWPIVKDGEIRTRLTYPVDEEKPSIPGVASFCTAYMSWYTATGCGALAGEIGGFVNQGDACGEESDYRAFEERILRGLPPRQRPVVARALRAEAERLVGPHQRGCRELAERMKAVAGSMASRCQIMYDGAQPSEMKFNADRAEDLKNLASFCLGVQGIERGKFPWRPVAGGGGATAVVLAVLKFGGKFIGLFRKAGAGVKAAGEGAKAAGEGISSLSRGIDAITAGIKQLFGRSLPALGRALWDVVTFKWIRRKGPPPGGDAGAADGGGSTVKRRLGPAPRTRTPSAGKVRAVPKRQDNGAEAAKGGKKAQAKRMSESVDWGRVLIRMTPSPADAAKIGFGAVAALIAYRMALIAVKAGAAAATVGGGAVRLLGALDAAAAGALIFAVPTSVLTGSGAAPVPPERI